MPHFNLVMTGFPVRPFRYGLGLIGIACENSHSSDYRAKRERERVRLTAMVAIYHVFTGVCEEEEN